MSSNSLIPLYFDGQDRRTEPVAFKSHQEIKAQRKAGALEGWYQENGRVFILYRAVVDVMDILQMVAGSGFDTAWKKAVSGICVFCANEQPECAHLVAGPIVWQLKTESGVNL